MLHDDDGEVISYRTSSTTALAVNRPHAAPLWLLALLAGPEPPEVSQRRHPSQFDLGDSVADKARDGWDWLAELLADGWTFVRWHGEDSEWTRPGKNPRDGTSATLHGGAIGINVGPLVVWSTSVAQGGVATQGGIGRSYSPWDYIVTFRAGGDTKVAAALVRGAAPGRAIPVPPPVEATTPSRLPTLPPEFWEHPVNAHILAAARARRCGPDALVLNVLLRASMLIPPSFLLPPLAGGFSPINLLGCVVGRTGEGKSVSIAAASDVLSVEHPWLLWDMPLGSGEGVGDVFMMDELEDTPKGKKRTGRRVQNPNLLAVHFTVDEGAALVEQSTRKGATIIPALCKAWTGVTLGETNADVTTRRRVKALSYRVAAVINIQPANFHRLFNTLNTGTGLTGRFLFAPAADYDMPDERGEWPGPLVFPELHGSTFGNTLDYHPDIYAEVDAAIVAANRGGGTPENVSHANLLRARVAAIYALWEQRRVISPTDWYTAGLLTRTSADLLNGLDQQAAFRQRDERHATARARAEVEIVVEDVKDRQGIARMAEAIRRKVADGALARAEIRKSVSAGSTRHRFDAALDLAISNGWVRMIEDRIEEV